MAPTGQGRGSSAAPPRALQTHHPPGKKLGQAKASPAVFGDAANAMCQSRDPVGEQRGGSTALQGAGRSLPSPPFLLPSIRDAALSTRCAGKGLWRDAVRMLSAEHGYMLSADIWAELSRLTSPQDSSSHISLSNITLLCGFLCLLFPPARASQRSWGCCLCKQLDKSSCPGVSSALFLGGPSPMAPLPATARGLGTLSDRGLFRVGAPCEVIFPVPTPAVQRGNLWLHQDLRSPANLFPIPTLLHSAY